MFGGGGGGGVKIKFNLGGSVNGILKVSGKIVVSLVDLFVSYSSDPACSV